MAGSEYQAKQLRSPDSAECWFDDSGHTGEQASGELSTLPQTGKLKRCYAPRRLARVADVAPHESDPVRPQRSTDRPIDLYHPASRDGPWRHKTWQSCRLPPPRDQSVDCVTAGRTHKLAIGSGLCHSGIAHSLEHLDGMKRQRQAGPRCHGVKPKHCLNLPGVIGPAWAINIAGNPRFVWQCTGPGLDPCRRKAELSRMSAPQ